MKIIKYIQLYTHLIEEEGLNPISAYQSTLRVRKLPVELKDAVLQVLDGMYPEIEYHEVTLKELIEKDEMKPIRAILMLDWIRREPAIAMRYMAFERLRAPQQVTDDDKAKLKAALQRLKGEETPLPEKDETDIPVE